jgi:hypothetical protein|tara:strand:+ start:68520 stop:69080 length:561 start_codon:yes stop_codon:yes gene_type:complete
MKTYISKTIRILFIVRLIFLLIGIVLSISTYAQHNHGSHGGGHTIAVEQSPNGGEVKNAGKYKIEMVANLFLKKDQLSFYLLKNNLKPIPNEGSTGTITIEYKDGSTTTDSLLAKGDDHFVAQLEKLESFTCTVKVQVKGKIVSAVFSYSGLELNTTSVYTCSMHPEIEQNKSGACSKCGMELIEK